MLRPIKVDPELEDLVRKHPLELLEIIHANPESERAASARDVIEYLKYRISFWHSIAVLLLSAVVAIATLAQVFLAIYTYSHPDRRESDPGGGSTSSRTIHDRQHRSGGGSDVERLPSVPSGRSLESQGEKQKSP